MLPFLWDGGDAPNQRIPPHELPASTHCPSLAGAEIQWGQNSDEPGMVLCWRHASQTNGHRWVVSFDELWTSQTTMDEFRVWDVWGSYLAAASIPESAARCKPEG